MKRRALPGIAAVLALLGGCAVGPDFVRPDPAVPASFTRGGDAAQTPAGDGVSQRFTDAAALPADWWRMFGSAALDGAMDEALAGNPTLQAAQANLRQSEAAMRAGAGVFYPQLDATAGATRQAATPVRFGQAVPSSVFNLFSLTATVSYTLDLFGLNRRAVEALSAQVDLQRQMLGATYLVLTGNLVNTVIAQAGYAAQIQATTELAALVREQVEITGAQVQAGTAAHVSELSLAVQLASLEATLPPLRQRLEQADHLAATLSGHYPAESDPVAVTLETLRLPADIPRLLPAELVRRRPDVLLAEAQLHVASADVGVATAAMFPAVTLSAGYGRDSLQIGSLFGGNSAVWSLGAGIAAPLFHGGELYYRRQAAVAQWEAAQAGYRQVVLAAFGQVADALRALEHDGELVAATRQARDLAFEALQELQANFQAGTAGYLQVLVANAQYHQADIGYLQARTQRLQDTVALFLALGGGWDAGAAQAQARRP
ncbi:efflux transporter outer membrane subunit [Cupriavidus basilensis]|uniref:efflux transporter outer membrane subunit n=1 Tax=Cupriavidus basilensis TaxID=68895 RepID=UPI0023E7959D|nr:efflux transporter outer membrane subunit [Cupriavidus basilensis]MDF3887188.1 efflux transporter outer membrane subunit [Cupriavidus basilensis]